MSYKVGDLLGSYQLLFLCGNGAYGAVFLAENVITKHRFALKIIYTRGLNCSRELAGLTRYQILCPRTNLLQIYHVEQTSDCFWYTMDAADNLSSGPEQYIPDTLRNRLRKYGRLPAEEIRKMVEELVANLKLLHARGLLHRDVKPDNILWVDGSAILGDIGLVTEDQNASLAGTPGFLPPLVLAGIRQYSETDDFYSLGKVIYCALTGMPVEKYPEFPDSLSLSDNKDLVRLYNRLCAGELNVALSSPHKLNRKIVLCMISVMVIFLSIVLTIFFSMMHARKLSPKQVGGSVPVWKALPPVSQTAEQTEKRRNYLQEFEKLKKSFAPSEKFRKLYPFLKKEKKKLDLQVAQLLSEAISSPISESDLTEIEKYLIKHPELPYSLDAKSFLRMKHQNEVLKKVSQMHREDPLLHYFQLVEKLPALIQFFMATIQVQGVEHANAFHEIQNVYQELGTLESILIKKYENFSE